MFNKIRKILVISLLIIFSIVLILFWGSFLFSGENFNDFLKEIDEVIPMGGCREGCWFVV